MLAGSEPPHAEKSFVIGIEGLFAAAGGFDLGASTGVGSGVAHALFEPHASELENPPKVLGLLICALGAALVEPCDMGAGAERLKAELRSRFGAATGAFWGAFLGGEGSDMSNKSLEALDVAGFAGAAGGLEAKLKSPKSFDSSGVRLA